jgi:hypothetical protein
MGDREWWAVETAEGRTVDLYDREYPSREAAQNAAVGAAPRWEQPLMVVKYTRQEFATVAREVAVTMTDRATGAQTPM